MENSGLISMLRDNKVDDLKRMYSLFGRVSTGHQNMREMMSTFIKTTGMSIINDEEKQKDHITLVGVSSLFVCLFVFRFSFSFYSFFYFYFIRFFIFILFVFLFSFCWFILFFTFLLFYLFIYFIYLFFFQKGLLELKDKYDKIVATAFGADKTFVQAVNQVIFLFEKKISRLLAHLKKKKNFFFFKSLLSFSSTNLKNLRNLSLFLSTINLRRGLRESAMRM